MQVIGTAGDVFTEFGRVAVVDGTTEAGVLEDVVGGMDDDCGPVHADCRTHFMQ